MSETKFISQIYSIANSEIGRPHNRSKVQRANKIMKATLIPYQNDGRTRVEILFETGGGPPNMPNINHPFTLMMLPVEQKPKTEDWVELELEDKVIVDGQEMKMYYLF